MTVALISELIEIASPHRQEYKYDTLIISIKKQLARGVLFPACWLSPSLEFGRLLLHGLARLGSKSKTQQLWCKQPMQDRPSAKRFRILFRKTHQTPAGTAM